jgi:hypothetical protein
MKVAFKFILFMVMFNVSAFFIASLGIFPVTVYGDLFVTDSTDTSIVYNMSDPNDLPSEQDLLARFLYNTPQFGRTVQFGPYHISLTFWGIVVVFFGIVAAASIVMQSITPVLGGVVVLAFLFMYLNSKSLFEQILSNQPAAVNYLMLMVGLGVIIMFLITAFDYAAGQSSG